MSATLTLVQAQAAASPATAHPASASSRRKWYTLAVLCLSLLITVVDSTIVNVALPSLARDLRAGTSGLQWITDSYTLAFGALLLLAGAMALAYCDFGLANPGLYRVMFASPLPPVADLTLIPGRSAFEQRTAAIAAALGASGDPHDQDGSAFRASVLLWQLLHGTVNLRISRPVFPWPPLADTVTTATDLILDRASALTL